MTFRKIQIRKRGKHCRETGETPKVTVKTPRKTCGVTSGNRRKQLGNRGDITLRVSPL